MTRNATLADLLTVDDSDADTDYDVLLRNTYIAIGFLVFVVISLVLMFVVPWVRNRSARASGGRYRAVRNPGDSDGMGWSDPKLEGHPYKTPYDA